MGFVAKLVGVFRMRGLHVLVSIILTVGAILLGLNSFGVLPVQDTAHASKTVVEQLLDESKQSDERFRLLRSTTINNTSTAIYLSDAYQRSSYTNTPMPLFSFKTNENGFRTDQYNASPPAGTVRITVTGNSNIAGLGVNRTDTMTYQLERILENALPCSVQVLNLGVNGLGVDDFLLHFNAFHAPINPDLTIVAYEPHDVLSIEDREQLQERIAPDGASFGTFRQERRHRQNQLQQRLLASGANRSKNLFEPLETLREAARQQKIETLVYNHRVPYSNQPSSFYATTETIREMYRTKESWLTPENSHHNPETHQLHAERLASIILSDYTPLC